MWCYLSRGLLSQCPPSPFLNRRCVSSSMYLLLAGGYGGGGFKKNEFNLSPYADDDFLLSCDGTWIVVHAVFVDLPQPVVVSEQQSKEKMMT